MATKNGVASGSIPTGTAPEASSPFLQKLKTAFELAKGGNLETLQQAISTGLGGGLIDDKAYLMEHIIQLVSDLPLHGGMSDTLTHTFLNQLWDDLSHPPDSYLGYNSVFRKADGSNNNVLWPQIGQAGQPYARSVKPRKMQPPPPDPSVIFESVLRRPTGQFTPHPNKISSVLFYLASIIIHDCFHTSHKDYAISETSSYLDLAPLYGSSLEDQLKVREMKDGKLKPDCFADARIMGFPPGVGVMLIMFNRFHNEVVENLAKIDENGRFSALKSENKRTRRRTGLTPTDGTVCGNQSIEVNTLDGGKIEGKAVDGVGKKERTADQDYDEALFQTGRLITTGLYINIVLQDYVRTILGLNRVDSVWNLDPRQAYGNAFLAKKIPEAQGNQVSAEFSLVYRWHSCVSKRDEAWTEKFIDLVKEEATKMIPAIEKRSGEKLEIPNDPTMKTLTLAAIWADVLQQTPPRDRKFLDHDLNVLKRSPDTGRYSDDDLCKLWTDSVSDVAGAFGANHVPQSLAFVEVLSILQARSWNLASLNEFREYFKLAPHETFESINPDPKVAGQLKKLYGHPDNVEIYPGIVVESAKKAISPGSGLCASWTTSRAILADAVSLVRSDRFHTVDYTPKNLTNWGFHASSYDLDINFGGVFYKLVLNAFPHNLHKNSVYAHFPLVQPDENKTILKDLERVQLYNFDAFTPSKGGIVTAKATNELGLKALTDSSEFASLWISQSAAFDIPSDAKGTFKADTTFAESILADNRLKSAATDFYASTIPKLWESQKYKVGSYQGAIDVVGDVLNEAHAAFITSLLGIEHDDSQSFLSALGHLFDDAHSNHSHPKGLVAGIRDSIHAIADAILGGLFGSAKKPTSKTAEIGQAAFGKLKAASGGANAKQLTWHEVLPAASLLLTVMSRSSAASVEQLLGDTAAPTIGSIAKVAGSDTGAASKDQVVSTVLPAAASAEERKKYGPEVELALTVAEIANAAIKSTFEKTKGLKRMPGPQGHVKKIQMPGDDVRYLNATESDYVAYPVSLKVVW